MIGKICKKCKLNSEKIWEMWEKSRLNCDTIMKIRRKVSGIVKRWGNYRRK
jgi:hypothetical protein